jgi:hypothetical protein
MFAPAFGASRFLAGTDQKHFTYPAAIQAEEIKQGHIYFSFLVLATLAALVSGTGHIHREFGQFTGFQQLQVFQHIAFHGPEHLDSQTLEFQQCSAPDAAYHYLVHGGPPQGLDRLALTVGMMGVRISNGFKGAIGTV